METWNLGWEKCQCLQYFCCGSIYATTLWS